MDKHYNKNLVIAIVFASLVISGSLVFLGFQMMSKQSAAGTANLDKSIEDGIEKYIAKQEEIQRKAYEEQQKKKELGVGKLREPSKDADHIRGSLSAEFSLIEYSDFDCPYCAAIHPTLAQLVKDYNGKINWAYRSFPLPGHDPSATAKAVAAECVAKLSGNEVYWNFADKLFEEQRSITSDEKDMRGLAEKVGVNGNSFSTCLKDEAILSKVKASLVEGSVAGVGPTPSTILLNKKTGEKRLVEGAQRLEYFKAKIDEMMKAKN